jgi:hypothetical protein
VTGALGQGSDALRSGDGNCYYVDFRRFQGLVCVDLGDSVGF